MAGGGKGAAAARAHSLHGFFIWQAAAKERLQHALKASAELAKMQKEEARRFLEKPGPATGSGVGSGVGSVKFPEPPGYLQLDDTSLAAELMGIWAFLTSFSQVCL